MKDYFLFLKGRRIKDLESLQTYFDIEGIRAYFLGGCLIPWLIVINECKIALELLQIKENVHLDDALFKAFGRDPVELHYEGFKRFAYNKVYYPEEYTAGKKQNALSEKGFILGGMLTTPKSDVHTSYSGFGSSASTVCGSFRQNSNTGSFNATSSGSYIYSGSNKGDTTSGTSNKSDSYDVENEVITEYENSRRQSSRVINGSFLPYISIIVDECGHMKEKMTKCVSKKVRRKPLDIVLTIDTPEVTSTTEPLQAMEPPKPRKPLEIALAADIPEATSTVEPLQAVEPPKPRNPLEIALAAGVPEATSIAEPLQAVEPPKPKKPLEIALAAGVPEATSTAEPLQVVEPPKQRKPLEIALAAGVPEATSTAEPLKAVEPPKQRKPLEIALRSDVVDDTEHSSNEQEVSPDPQLNAKLNQFGYGMQCI